MTPQEILLAAADYIEKHGWCQRRYEDRGAVCVEGALLKVAKGDGIAWAHASSMLRLHLEGLWPLVWNDETGRTQQQVIAALREAANG